MLMDDTYHDEYSKEQNIISSLILNWKGDTIKSKTYESSLELE